MLFFNRKPTATVNKLAEAMAHAVARSIVADFDDEENFWLHEHSGLQGKPELLQEWILFRLFCGINGYIATMNNAATNIKFSKTFLRTCGEIYIAEGIFSSMAAYEQLGKDRFSDYASTLDDREGSESMKIIGRRFLGFAHCSQNDPVQLLGATSIFSIYSIAAKETLEEMLQKFRLVE